MSKVIAELQRQEDYRNKTSNWKHWGPYLSERSWGTVREDYSAGGNAWTYFPHDHARSRTYRWGEDGIAGISDRNQNLCFSLAYWNTKDVILKERMFGLSTWEGNHGEDVKDYYFYLDSTPTHSYMKMLYKYPQAEYPYTRLVSENQDRFRTEPEYELVDTGVLDNSSYFDCFVEYAKADQDDILIRITVANRSDQVAPLYVMPTLWFRNTWSWGYPNGPMKNVDKKPSMFAEAGNDKCIKVEHVALGNYRFYCEDSSTFLFTDNETNTERIFKTPNENPFQKDAFHRYLIDKETTAVNPKMRGTKACVLIKDTFAPKETKTYHFRLSNKDHDAPFANFSEVFSTRISEADEFYEEILDSVEEEAKNVQRQALSGMLWTKQLYYYDLEQWLAGDPAMPAPPEARKSSRNKDWTHLTNFDIISMPDKWEFPWYAAWDLAFHAVPFATVDPDFAKRQLELLTREWYMHPNGAFPAYEWAFNDVNPPVHAWATLKTYEIDSEHTGKKDTAFLEGTFHKLLQNFTWWVNRKDVDGNNVFQGGFLGLDNIGPFDRSKPLPDGGRIDQADATSWMAAYCLTMLKISLELAETNPVYEDSASKFLEHFLRVANAMTNVRDSNTSLWNEEDGFFYDVLIVPGKEPKHIKVRSVVGLLPLFAVDTIEPDSFKKYPDFYRRLKWFVRNRQHLAGNMARIDVPGVGRRRLMALLTEERLIRVLRYMFDESEFLSPYGIRSLSKFHKENPYSIEAAGETHSIGYEPGDSLTALFGGNSNWRGPVWFPINFLLIEGLRKFHFYYGEQLKVEYPTHSGKFLTLGEIADDLSKRLASIFQKGSDGSRAFYGENHLFESDSNFSDLFLFNEFFHGDTGQGLGASHQTGWTGLVATLLQKHNE